MIQAEARKIVDYSTYDGSASWRKREKLLIADLITTLRQEALSQKLNTDRAIIASGHKFKNLDKLIDNLYKSTDILVYNTIPWAKPKTELTDSEISPEIAKLIDKYNRIFDTKEVNSASSGS